jgi:hypothetical protein
MLSTVHFDEDFGGLEVVSITSVLSFQTPAYQSAELDALKPYRVSIGNGSAPAWAHADAAGGTFNARPNPNNLQSTATAWNWTITGNTIFNAGTGIYFGNSNGEPDRLMSPKDLATEWQLPSHGMDPTCPAQVLELTCPRLKNQPGDGAPLV